MKWPRLFRGVGSYRLLRELLRQQQAQTLALENLAKATWALARQGDSDRNGGFVTGAYSAGLEAGEGGISYTTNADIVELLDTEQELKKAWGRNPTEEEVVSVWNQRQR